MDIIEKAKENLKIIYKNGDLYNAIAHKMNVRPRRYSFLKTNILLLSRLAFLGILIGEKITSHFSPVERNRKAQNEIRNIMGVNVDIILYTPLIDNQLQFPIDIKLQERKKKLSILYEKNFLSTQNYVENLKKILHFCELHGIDKIFLKKQDLTEISNDILSDFKDIKFKDILNSSSIISEGEEYNELFLALNPSDLLKIINLLESVKIDKVNIAEFKEQIEDMTIKNAIEDFLNYGDLAKLKIKVQGRLQLHLNSMSITKDKINGKVYDFITLQGKFVRILSSNSKGEIINSSIMLLCEYLGFKNYKNLLDEIDKPNDANQLYLIAALYLYLNNEDKTHFKTKDKSLSFFDQIYKDFKNKKIKDIHGMYTKRYKHLRNFKNGLLSVIFSFFLAAILFTGGCCLSYIQYFITNDYTLFTNLMEKFILPYQYSYELEWDLVDNAKNLIQTVGEEGFLEDTKETVKSYVLDLFGEKSETGDSNIKKEITFAKVTPLTDNCQLPHYFASGYATSGYYENGETVYSISKIDITTKDFVDVEELFEVQQGLNFEHFQESVQNNTLTIPAPFFPIGNNYVITSVEFRDMENPEIKFSLDSYRTAGTITLSKEEQTLLLSMQDPNIFYTYGISSLNENTFVKYMEKLEPYIGISSMEAKEAITKGLGLDEDASLEEIYNAIKNKKYSQTPLKDAGISHRIKKYEEKKYYKTIADLDSLICNLAASLMVTADDELVYVIGYYESGDNYITNLEGHAWAMDSDGTIYDATPAIEEENDEISETIKNIMRWSINHLIDYRVALVLVALLIYKWYGKKIKFTLKVKNSERLLQAPEIEKYLAIINDVLYGEINVPIKQQPSALADTISDEFYNISISELKELKKRILSNNLDKDTIKKIKKLLDYIPFIKDHPEEIKAYINKPKKKNKKN